MAEMGPVTNPQPGQGAPEGPKTGNVWTRKHGPLPLWGWAAVVLGILLAYMYWKNRNGSTQNAASVTGASSTTAGQVPQFVNQVYTQTAPPSAPPTTAPPTPSTTGQTDMVYRDTASGQESLAQYAKARGTTVAHLVETTKAARSSGGITPENLSKFLKYVAGGTNKKMPKGLVFYTSNPNPISKGGVNVPA